MKNNTIQKLVNQLQDKHGADSVMVAKDMPRNDPISSGSLALDYAIGVGGLPSDRVMEIAGPEGSGKTTLALLAMQQFLAAQPDRGALILDIEHKLDRDWLEFLIGPEVLENRVIYVQPNHIEQATNIYRSAVESGGVCFAILDSIGGAPTIRRNSDAEVASFGGNSMGVGEFARTAGALSAKYKCLTVGINQIRADVSGYNRHLVPGGHAWLYAVTLRLQLKRGKGKVVEKINGEEHQIGYEIACKVIKSGLSAPGRTASWWFHNIPTERYGFGIDRLEEIVRLGILTGVIERRGGWYHHPALPEEKGEHKILGRDRLMDTIRDSEPLQKLFSEEITGRLKSGDFGAEVAPLSDPDAPIEDSKFPNLLTKGEFDE